MFQWRSLQEDFLVSLSRCGLVKYYVVLEEYNIQTVVILGRRVLRRVCGSGKDQLSSRNWVKFSRVVVNCSGFLQGRLG